MSTEYKVITVTDLDANEAAAKLGEAVRRHLDAGWIVTGGVALTPRDTRDVTGYVAAQAMTREVRPGPLRVGPLPPSRPGLPPSPPVMTRAL